MKKDAMDAFKNYIKIPVAWFCINIVPLLLILLFAYTATAKLMAHAKTLSQLTDTGLVQPLAQIAAYAVPIAELLTAILLGFKRSRLKGLWCAFFALLFFTGYVAVILSGSNIPCSCGGVIAAMSWKQHLYFNIFFLLLSILSLHYHKRYYAYNKEVS